MNARPNSDRVAVFGSSFDALERSIPHPRGSEDGIGEEDEGMKAVLMSIKPKWCEMIASGKKTIEIRKTEPKLKTPFKCYIYCTKGGSLMKTADNNCFIDNTYIEGQNLYGLYELVNGKVIGEFVCDRIYEIKPHFDTPTFPNQYICGWDYGKDFDCLSFEELTSYLNGKQGYGWHISDLVIYDKPRELREFEKPWKEWIDTNGNWHDIRPCQCGKPCKHALFDYGENAEICGIDYDGENCPYIKITRPPQSWCYVEVQV